MRLIPSDPDVATIHRRISDGDLDLQPNFQRGEVWTSSKKQKLIDSILREWHVPPIHIIQGLNGAQDEVLDGQQRLASIRDFIDGNLCINGKIEPFDEKIFSLDGLKFSQIPDDWKRRILRFPIRIFSIVDFSPSEPSELFYRLNQPASLTAAEQRNSFFGKPREQIKDLVLRMENLGLDQGFLGFSNSRMAYDDVLARVCVALERGLGAKVSANLLADRYRSGVPFQPDAYNRADTAITILAKVREQVEARFKLNKASLFSWLIFICRLLQQSPNYELNRYANFLASFEGERLLYSLGVKGSSPLERMKSSLYEIYTDRVTSRVADASSVMLRDASLWGLFFAFQNFAFEYSTENLARYSEFLREQEKNNSELFEKNLNEFLFDDNVDWGRI
jgi:hypothetical protein